MEIMIRKKRLHVFKTNTVLFSPWSLSFDLRGSEAHSEKVHERPSAGVPLRANNGCQSWARLKLGDKLSIYVEVCHVGRNPLTSAITAASSKSLQ